MARAVLTMIAVCLLVSACGPAPEGTSGAQSPSPGGPTAPVGQPTPQRVEPRPGTIKAQPMAWERADPSEDGRTLTIIWSSGPEPCFVLDRVEVAQSPEAVTVTLYEGRDPQWPEGALCPAILIKKATTVTLDEPLGDRQVIDGAPQRGS